MSFFQLMKQNTAMSNTNIAKKYLKNCKTELLIKADGKTLVTCFYCDFLDYFFNAKKIENYYFIKNLKTNNHGKLVF